MFIHQEIQVIRFSATKGMPDFGLSERESINLNSSGNLLYQKPPTPTSSPPPHRRRTTSNSSTEIVRQSHDFADMSDFEEDLAPNLVKIKQNGLDQDANQQIIIESGSLGKCSDGRQQAPIVSDSRLDSRHKCRTVTRTHSLREALVRKFGTSYSCRSHGNEETTKHSQQGTSETDTSRSNKPIIGSQVKSQSPVTEKSAEPLGVEKPNSDIKTADNNTQNIPKNPDSPKRISSFIPSEISSDDTGLSYNIDVATSQGSNSNSIPLTSYLPKKFAHPGQAATANSNDETKAHQNKSQKDANNRSSSVNRSGVLAPDSIFGHGLFKLKKSPSTTELPTSMTGMGIDSSASKVASNQESDTSLKKQVSPNSTLNKQSESNRTSPTQQKLHRANIARHRPGSVRISNVMVLPDKMLKDKANSSECLAGIGVVDSNPTSVKKWSFTKNGSQENLTTSEVSSCIPHIPRPPALKKPATDSDDFSESDGKVSQPNLVLPSRRCPIKSTTAADQKSNNTTTKSAMKISSNNMYGRVKELTGLEDSDVDSNIEDENFSDIDCNQNAIADSESTAPPINTPKIRQPSAYKLSRHSPPTSISGNITSSPSSSPPKSVTWNLTADVLNIEQDPSELSSSRKHRHQKHQRHHSNEGVNSDRLEGNDHRQRINRTPKQAFVSSNVSEEGNSTTELLNQEPKMDQESHVVTAIHESFLENATINLKEQMDALQNFKRGLTPLESYREAISRCLSIQEQTVRKMIKYLKKE